MMVRPAHLHARFATGEEGRPHLPVMLAEVLRAASPADGETVVDGTFGAGGYSRGLLNAADCRLVAIDRDPTVRPHVDALAADFGDRFRFIAGRFGDLDRLLDDAGVAGADVVVFDFGVSSMQLDQAERGFSFMRDGPLDMRMGDEGPTAADLVNTLDEKALADIIFRYGEERASRRIARAIVAKRPFSRTGELAEAVRSVMPRSRDGIDPATRTFQALRIAVNDELREIERGLAAAERVLKPGGRLVVVSFHSLEDRLVKRFLAERSGRRAQPSRHMPVAETGPEPSFRLIERKPVTAGDDEIARNPRARSAKLRWAVRTDAPAWEDDSRPGRAAP